MIGIGILMGALLGNSAVLSGGQAEAPDPPVVQLALQAVQCAEARGVQPRQQRLTIIDYSLPSTQRRLWVLDLRSHQWLFHEWVAHGKNTGENYAHAFSNQPSSEQSSLGLFLTGARYEGSHGLSLRLVGLEPGYNDKALDRDLVLHGAWYVSQTLIDQYGRLGRSWGCPAVRPAIVSALIDAIGGGSFLFAYYPDPGWLRGSKLLNDCDGATRRS